jgi:hypothetical protein
LWPHERTVAAPVAGFGTLVSAAMLMPASLAFIDAKSGRIGQILWRMHLRRTHDPTGDEETVVRAFM